MGHAAVQREGATAAMPLMGRDRAEVARAMLSVVMIAVAPDGEARAGGAGRALVICADSPAFAGLDAADLRQLAGWVLRALAGRGPGAVIADVQGLLSPERAETALCLAVRAVLAGSASAGAMDRLGALSHRLGVPVDRFATMIEILRILDRPVG
ncbi:MAG: hypothetical protein KF887_14740 [Paracoccaceae bacterium]|nr:MAG: hypothetical protein KF887_14740 [Paracoccaceae bacterium]